MLLGALSALDAHHLAGCARCARPCLDKPRFMAVRCRPGSRRPSTYPAHEPWETQPHIGFALRPANAVEALGVISSEGIGELNVGKTGIYSLNFLRSLK